MTSILFLGDSQRDPKHRAVEHDRVLHFIEGEVHRRMPSVVAHGGDWTERTSTHEDREVIFRWVQNIGLIAPLVTVQGNHEEADFVTELSRLATREGVCAAISPRVDAVGGAVWLLLPWPKRAMLATYLERRLGRPASTEETDASANAMLQDVLRGLREEAAGFPPEMPRVLLLHAEPDTYDIGGDQPQVARGMRVAVDDMVRLTGADLVLLSHIHKPSEQYVVRDDGVRVPVLLAGSPRVTAFSRGEMEPKRVLWIEFDGRTPRWESVRTPCTPLVLCEARWTEHTDVRDGQRRLMFEGGPPDVVADAEIRLRWEVPSDMRDAARAAARALSDDWIERGALAVKLEECVLPTASARAPEVARAVGIRAKYLAMMRARGEDVAAPRAERLVALAEAVDAEVAA